MMALITISVHCMCDQFNNACCHSYRNNDTLCVWACTIHCGQLFAVQALFIFGSYGDADASRVDVGAVVPDVGVQNNCVGEQNNKEHA